MQLAIVIPVSDLGGGLPSQGLPGIPGYPSQGLPGGPGHPSQGLPGGPAGGPVPTPPIHLPPQAGQLPIYPANPSHPIELPPGSVWPPLGPSVPSGKALAVVWIQGFGYRWTVIDTTVHVNPAPPGMAQPKA
jgi:hypothetical protein